MQKEMIRQQLLEREKLDQAYHEQDTGVIL